MASSIIFSLSREPSNISSMSQPLSKETDNLFPAARASSTNFVRIRFSSSCRSFTDMLATSIKTLPKKGLVEILNPVDHPHHCQPHRQWQLMPHQPTTSLPVEVVLNQFASYYSCIFSHVTNDCKRNNRLVRKFFTDSTGVLKWEAMPRSGLHCPELPFASLIRLVYHHLDKSQQLFLRIMALFYKALSTPPTGSG